MTGIICSIAGATYAAAARTAKTVTANGQAQVDTAQSKFGGASLFLNGSSSAGNTDYLEVSSNLGDLIGDGDITYECFFRTTVDNAQAQYILSNRRGTFGSFGWVLSVRFDLSDQIQLLMPGTNGTTSSINSSTAVTVNTWFHVAVVRNGTSIKLYVNGTEEGTPITLSSYPDAGVNFFIGNKVTPGSATQFEGHIDEVRVSNTARYTATFTPTATAFANDVDTLLLLHCDGTDATTVFTDDIGTNAIPRTPKTVTANGNAQVDTAQSAFGGASALFDGTGDYLQTAGNADFDLASTDFTVEGWFRKSVSVNAALIGNYEFNTRGGFSLFTWSNNSLLIGSRNSADTGLQFYQSANNVSTDSQFNHFAVCRSGLNMQVYCEGTRVINRTDFYIKNWATASNAKITVGRSAGSAGGTWSDVNYEMNGHIDEIRVSKITRYSGATYTEPTAAFTNDRDTLLLVHCNGTDASTTFTDDNA